MTDFRKLYDRANSAGVQAAMGADVEMIRVADMQTGRVYDPFPICGFAWVVVQPGNSAFANWLKKNALADKAYEGGVKIWIGDYNQSYDRKYAHARAMAKVLADAGINAYANGRLD